MWELTLDTSLENIANTTSGRLDKLRGRITQRMASRKYKESGKRESLFTRGTWRNSGQIKTYPNPAGGRLIAPPNWFTCLEPRRLRKINRNQMLLLLATDSVPSKFPVSPYSKRP